MVSVSVDTEGDMILALRQPTEGKTAEVQKQFEAARQHADVIVTGSRYSIAGLET